MRALFAAIVISLLCVSVAGAQADESLTAVEAALVEFRQLERYTFSGATSLRQEVTSVVGMAVTTIEQSVEGSASGSGTQAAFDIEQTSATDGESVAWRLTIERVDVEDAVYLRFGELELPADAPAAITLPEGWFVYAPVSDPSTLSPADLGVALFIQGYAESPLLPPALGYPLDEQTVRTVERLPDETREGETLAVYEVSYNALGLYTTATREEWDRTFLSFAESGFDVVRFFFEGGLQVRARFWIDGEARLVEVEQQIRFEVQRGALPQVPDYGVLTNSRVRLQIDRQAAPVEVTPPPLGA